MTDTRSRGDADSSVSKSSVKFFKSWLGATLLFSIADFIFSWNPIAAAPYLAHRHEAMFRTPPLLGLGPWAELVNGLIATLAYSSVEAALKGSAWRRGAAFGLILWGFWVVSGTMTAFIWLDIPASLAATNVLFGLPKCLCIAWGVAWLSDKPAPAPVKNAGNKG